MLPAETTASAFPSLTSLIALNIEVDFFLNAVIGVSSILITSSVGNTSNWSFLIKHDLILASLPTKIILAP